MNKVALIIGLVMFGVGLNLIVRYTDSSVALYIGMGLCGGSYGLLWRDIKYLK